MHFARFSLSLQHDVRNTIMDEIEKNNQIVVTVSRQLQTEFDIRGLRKNRGRF